MPGPQMCSESWDCKVSAKRMWVGLFEDGHNCLPKALPHLISFVDYPFLYFEHQHHDSLIHFEGHKWCSPGGIRYIKFHPDDFLCKYVEVATEKFRHHEGALIKEDEKKAKKALQKIGEEVRVEEKKAVEDFDKVGELAKEEMKKVEVAIKEEVKKFGKELHELGEKVDESIEKAGESAEKFLEAQELFVKEKIEEVDHEALKIKFSIIEGFWLKKFFKNLQHSFEFEKKGEGGTVVHWKTEFEAFSEHFSNPFEGIKKHYFEIFKGVEEYLCAHEDYCHL